MLTNRVTTLMRVAEEQVRVYGYECLSGSKK